MILQQCVTPKRDNIKGETLLRFKTNIVFQQQIYDEANGFALTSRWTGGYDLTATCVE